MNGNETPAQDAVPDREGLENRSKALFDASVAELDGSTRSRLCQARHAALAQTRQRPRTVWWMPAMASAALAMVVALILPDLRPQPQTLSEENLAAADDLTLLMNDESLDLLEEMEFYAWLAETDALDSPAEPGSTET